jgi:hypothetical protein
MPNAALGLALLPAAHLHDDLKRFIFLVRLFGF